MPTLDGHALPPEPQPVLNPLTRAAIFLVVAISEGGEPVARDLLADLAGLQRSVGFRTPDDTLACIAGVGSQAWDRLFDGRDRPSCIRSANSSGPGTGRWRPRATWCSTFGPSRWACALSSPRM